MFYTQEQLWNIGFGSVVENIFITDETSIFNESNQNGGKNFKTTKNLAYHLTWDLYHDGNPYYENKKSNLAQIWAKSDENFKYNVII